MEEIYYKSCIDVGEKDENKIFYLCYYSTIASIECRQVVNKGWRNRNFLSVSKHKEKEKMGRERVLARS